MNSDILLEQMQTLSRQQSFAEHFILPDYQRLNVKNVLPQIEAFFEGEPVNSLSFPEDYFDEAEGASKIVLIIFDGLGYNRILAHLTRHDGTFRELAGKGTLKPITTTFPSTTSTVLTSVFSGLSPSQHQILGYHMFSKKYGLVFDTLDMKPVYGYSGQVELTRDYSKKIRPLLPQLEQRGIKTLVATKASIADSGLSQIIHRHQRLIPYLLSSDMIVQSRQALERQGPLLLVIYYSGVDTLAHKYGPYSEEVSFELTSIEHSLNGLISGLSQQTKKETLLVLTADHGVAETRKTRFLKDAPEVMDKLALPPVGDSRACFLYSKKNQLDSLSDAFNRNVEGFKLYPSGELIQRGVFGQPVNFEGLKENVGDFIAVAQEQNALQYPFFEDDRVHPQLGTHGGMTAEEMIVPLLSVRLSKL